MATTVVDNVMGTADFSSSHAPDQHTESSHYGAGDKEYNGSFSVYRSSTNITKSESPSCSYNLSSFSTQSRGCTNKNGEQANSFLEEHSLSMKSNYSSYDFEKILNDSSLQQSLKQEAGPQSSMDNLLGGNFDSYKSKTLGLDKPSENKWDFKTDYSSYACEKNTTNSAYDKSKQKYDFSNSDKFSSYEFSKADKFSKEDLSSDDFKSKPQSFDFEHLMQTYSLDSAKEVTSKLDKELGAPMKLHTKSSYDFEASEVAIRLRNTVQSDFLSNELWKGTPTKTEEIQSQGSNAVRTIEEILKHHGISDSAPVKKNCSTDDASRKVTNSSTTGQKDLSQNNECSKSSGSEPGQSFSSMQDKDPCKMYANLSSKDTNSSFGTEAAPSCTLLEAKSFATQGANSFTANSSQNNETSKTQNTENDPLKRHGSSVDYTSAGKYSMNSGSANFRMYEYGKSSPLSGDIPGSALHFPSKDAKKFGGNLEKSRFEAPQAEGKSTFNASKASHIDIIKNMGSATDALEYSMSSERQRLRKLDTMISATPFNYSSIELPRSLRAQYMSPERTYSSLMSSDMPSRRIYSTSNMPSTSTHGSRYPTRDHLPGRVGQPDSSTGLNKSISAPGSTGVQSVSSHGSSVDGRAAYWPYSSNRDYNKQYNNAYNPQLLEKLVRQKNDIGHQKKMPASKKKECPLKSTKDECSKRNDHMLYNQNPTGIQFLSNSQPKKPAIAEKRKVPGKMESKKKTADKDFNHSKNINGLYDGFDFVKDLNRMWQETVFGQQKKPAPNQKAKYTPYKPASQEKKDSKPTGGQSARDTCSKDLWQSSILRSDSGWALNNSAGSHGKLQTYGRDYSLQPVQKVRSQCSVMGPSNSQTKSKGSNSMTKTKPHASSVMTTKQQTTPKSILKQPTNNKTNCMPSHINRSQSSLATSSKSCTQTGYQMPYHMLRAFSPLEHHSASRPGSATLGKKQEPSTNKRLTSRTSIIPKQGRRL